MATEKISSSEGILKGLLGLPSPPPPSSPLSAIPSSSGAMNTANGWEQYAHRDTPVSTSGKARGKLNLRATFKVDCFSKPNAAYELGGGADSGERPRPYGSGDGRRRRLDIRRFRAPPAKAEACSFHRGSDGRGYGWWRLDLRRLRRPPTQGKGKRQRMF